MGLGFVSDGDLRTEMGVKYGKGVSWAGDDRGRREREERRVLEMWVFLCPRFLIFLSRLNEC